jgi:hypothetical protein
MQNHKELFIFLQRNASIDTFHLSFYVLLESHHTPLVADWAVSSRGGTTVVERPGQL